jgi:hypothetical protein
LIIIDPQELKKDGEIRLFLALEFSIAASTAGKSIEVLCHECALFTTGTGSL